MKNYSTLLAFILIAFLSCEKKYERPDYYNKDLFEHERGTNQAYVMSKDEAFEASAMVLSSSQIRVSDSSKGRGKDFFIYKLDSAKILKTTRDSVISYPFSFISEKRLKLDKKNQGPVYIYLETLKGYKFIAEERKIKYQWLKAAPVYKIEKEDK